MSNSRGKTMKRLFKFVVKRHKKTCFAILLLIIVSSIASVMGTIFIKSLIDDYITPYINMANPDFGPLTNAILKMIAIYAVGVIATFSYNKLLIKVTQGSLKEIRDTMFEHMEKLPIRYFDTHNHGDIMSIYTNDTDTLRQMISQSVPQVIVSATTIVCVLVSMIVMSIPMTIISVLMVCVMLLVSKHVTNRSGRYFFAQQTNLGKVNGFIEEMVEGSKVVKVFNHEQVNFAEFEKRNQALRQAATKAVTYSGTMIPTVVSISYLNYALSAVIGGFMAIYGIMDLGSLSSYLVFVRQTAMPVNQFSQQMNFILAAMSGAERIFEIMDEKVEIDEGNVTLTNVRNEYGKLVECHENTGLWAWRHPRSNGDVELVLLKGDVRFHDVCFSYVSNHPILKNLNLYAKPGQKIAFVGSTGAGKTTITNLINRFYELDSDSITYDGIDIKLIKKAALRQSLSMVLQDTHLFTGTIEDNIRYGKLDASDEEVVAAAKLANADSFIRRLPQGYQTMLTGDGSNLSQGQRQLLAIARAAIANPPVLILDEATSSIDTHTEKLIEKGMDSLMKDRTVFVIAHRLSTVRNSKAIMVLDHGEIIERGNHDELINQKGRYYQLYTGKMELS